MHVAKPNLVDVTLRSRSCVLLKSRNRMPSTRHYAPASCVLCKSRNPIASIRHGAQTSCVLCTSRDRDTTTLRFGVVRTVHIAKPNAVQKHYASIQHCAQTSCARRENRMPFIRHYVPASFVLCWSENSNSRHRLGYILPFNV